MPMRKGYRRKRPARKKQYKRKPVNKGNLRKRNLQPFVETKSVEATATSVYMDTTAASVSKPQATTILIPEAWKTLERGLTDTTFVGRDVFDRYLNMKCRITFDTLLPHTAATFHAQINNIKYVQFWVKDTVAGAVTPNLFSATEFKTLAGIAMVNDDYGAQFLQYKDKSAPKVKVIRSGYLRPKNKNSNFNPAPGAGEETPTQVHQYAEPINLSFTWRIQRKNRMAAVPNTATFLRSDSWIPGVAFFSASLHGQPVSNVPHVSHISKMWFSDS